MFDSKARLGPIPVRIGTYSTKIGYDRLLDIPCEIDPDPKGRFAVCVDGCCKEDHNHVSGCRTAWPDSRDHRARVASVQGDEAAQVAATGRWWDGGMVFFFWLEISPCPDGGPWRRRSIPWRAGQWLGLPQHHLRTGLGESDWHMLPPAAVTGPLPKPGRHLLIRPFDDQLRMRCGKI